MIGVLLVTHGQFCESMKESTEMVLGVQKNFYSLPLNPEDDIVCLQSRLLNKIQEMDQGEGVIVLVDLFGGSPYNAAASCLKHAHMECVAGMNFPMILGIPAIPDCLPISGRSSRLTRSLFSRIPNIIGGMGTEPVWRWKSASSGQGCGNLS